MPSRLLGAWLDPVWAGARRGELRLLAGAVAAGLMGGGCAFMGQRVPLAYAVSKNVAPAARKTALAPTAFLDKREEPSSVGRARMAYGLVKIPLRAKTAVAAWVEKAARADLEAVGYRFEPQAGWKLGGAVYEAWCAPAKRVVCRVRIEMWVVTQENMTVVKRMLKGEGARPELMPGDDMYALSLEDALREAVTAFRREIELVVP